MKKLTSLTFLLILTMQALAQPGSLIQNFGTNGVVRTNFGSLAGFPTTSHFANALMEGANGKFYTSTEIGGISFINRWNANGTLDISYGSDGYSRGIKVLLPSGAIQPDQKIVVGGFQGTSYAAARLDTAGNFDLTFGTDGKVTIPFTTGAPNFVYQTYIQTDGKILLAGMTNTGTSSAHFTLVRLLANGTQDSAFGNNGKLVTQLIVSSACRAIAQQSDGKIVAAGTIGGGATGLGVIMRFHPNGNLDSSFNGTGKLQVSEPIYSMVLQNNGKIVITGAKDLSATNIITFIKRLNSNGTNDISFNGTGTASLAFLGPNPALFNVRILPNGKIGATGRTIVTSTLQNMLFVRLDSNGVADLTFNGTGFRTVSNPNNEIQNNTHSGLFAQSDGKMVQLMYERLTTSSANTQIILRRLNTDGSDDVNFGVNGKAVAFLNQSETRFLDGVRQPDGKLVAAGTWNTTTTTTANNDFIIARFNPDGSFDNSFNGNGKVIFSFGPNNDVANAVLLQPDGKLIVGGNSIVGTTPFNQDFAITRLNTDGTPDNTFGTSGKLLLNFGSNSESLNGLALQPDGKIIAIGTTSLAASGTDFALARVNPDGSIDNSFGINGKVTTAISTGAGFDNAISAVLQKDGKIVVMGSHTNGGTKSIVVRYNANGTLDNTFNGNGRAALNLGAVNESVQSGSVKLQPDGKILAAASSVVPLTNPPSTNINQFCVVRFNTDGTLDNTFNGTGKVFAQLNGRRSFGASVGLQWDGRIIIASGLIGILNKVDVIVARYLPNGKPDLTFNGTGDLSFEVVDGDASLRAVIIDQEQAYVFGSGNHKAQHGFIAGVNLGTSVFCSYSQGTFGKDDKTVCDGVNSSNTSDIINDAIGSGFTIGRSGQAVIIPSGSAADIVAVLPGGGPSNPLPSGVVTLGTTMTGNSYLKNNGKLKNSLFAQTMVLMLNSRMTGGTLDNIPVNSGVLATQLTGGCGYDAEVVNCEANNSALSGFMMNSSVANYLSSIDASTVRGLIELANDILGGTKNAGQNGVPSKNDILAAIETINDAFSECRSFAGYNQELCSESELRMATNLSERMNEGIINVYPNPGAGIFNVELPGEVSEAVLTLTDINGKVIATKLLTTPSSQLDFNNQVKGIYLLQMQTTDATYRTKLVIN